MAGITKIVMMSAVFAPVAATDLALSWEDCGDQGTHAHAQSLSPNKITLGETTTITGSGSGDLTVDAGSFHVHATADGVTLVDHDGDICKADKINLPFGTGSLTWNGLNCPVQAGPVSLTMDVYLSKFIPSALQNAEFQLTAKSSKNEKLLCLKLTTTAPKNTVALGSNGACSADDQQKISSMPGGDEEGGFPKTTSDCGKGALSIWSGINKGKFNQCLQQKTQISEGCSSCYYNAAEYGFHNCKSACLFSWCSSSCLSCAKGYDTVGCAGFDGPEPTACDSSVAV